MTYRTCAGHYAYYNRLLGAVVVKPRTRGIYDLTGVTGMPWQGLRNACEVLRESGAFGITVYRMWANSWAIFYHYEGGTAWETGIPTYGQYTSRDTSEPAACGNCAVTDPPMQPQKWEQVSLLAGVGRS